MVIQIKKAVPEDADDLIRVQNQAFLEDFIVYGKCRSYGKTREKMLAAMEKRPVFKIMADDRIVGDMIISSRKEGYYHLSELCVIPEYEGRGIGGQAMRFLEIYFSDARHWSLETPADKTRNHCFYKKFGFTVTKRYMTGGVYHAFFEKEIETDFVNNTAETLLQL